MIRYVGDYDTALNNHRFDKNNIWVTITRKDECMPDIRINLLPNTPEIFIAENGTNLGIIREHEIEQHIQRLEQTQTTIQEIKKLFHEYFPGVL